METKSLGARAWGRLSGNLCLRNLARLAVSVLAFFALLTLKPPAGATSIATGAGYFIFSHGEANPGAPVTVWTYKPEKLSAYAPILFVMHGVNRNGEEYRDAWIKYAERFKALLLVPEFLQENFPGRGSYNLGRVANKRGEVSDPERTAFGVIERIFDHVVRSTGNKSVAYHIYGHSAGAQFAHRLILFKSRARVGIAVAANAGWYTVPSIDVDFPYGLRGARAGEDDLKRAFSKKLIVLLGERDIDPMHRSLNREPGAMKQGSNRLERGLTFFRASQKEAQRLGVSLNWELKTVPDTEHDNLAMARAAAPLLLK